MIHSFLFYHYHIIFLQNFKTCLVLLTIHNFLLLELLAIFIYRIPLSWLKYEFTCNFTETFMILKNFFQCYSLINCKHILIPRSKKWVLKHSNIFKRWINLFFRANFSPLSHLKNKLSTITITIWCFKMKPSLSFFWENSTWKIIFCFFYKHLSPFFIKVY